MDGPSGPAPRTTGDHSPACSATPNWPGMHQALLAAAAEAGATRAFSPAESQNRVRDMSTTTRARPGSATSSRAARSPVALAMSISSGAVTTGTPSTTSTGKLISGTAPPPGPDRSTTDRSDIF